MYSATLLNFIVLAICIMFSGMKLSEWCSCNCNSKAFSVVAGCVGLWSCSSRCFDGWSSCLLGKGCECHYLWNTIIIPIIMFPLILIVLCFARPVSKLFLCADWLVSFGSFWVIKYSEMAVLCRASILATEVEWLNSIKADLVVIDAWNVSL